MSASLTGTGKLLRGYLRRDRWIVLWWTLGTVVIYVSQAISVKGLYPTQADFDKAADSMADNAAFIAMAGPARALNTVGGQVFWQATAFGAVLVGLMSMFLIGRHTRVEEESGRDELIRSAAIGRHAPLVAALSLALLANLVIGVMVAVTLIPVPLSVADSLGTGLGLTLVGWVFSGSALVAAQLTQSPRSMYGIAGTVIGVAYGLRAVGDIGAPPLTWASPIGWYQGMHAFSGLQWWPCLILLVAAAAASVGAVKLFDRRDVGSGLLAARPGPAVASRGLTTGIGLAWRLHRGAIIGWTLGLTFSGLAYGAIGNSVEDLIGDSDLAKAFGAGMTGDLVAGFYATAIAMLALITSGFAVSSTMRPRAEEDAGHLEVLAATALPRWAWLAGHTAMTIGGVLVALAGAGLGLGVGFAATTGDWDALARLGLPVLAYAAPVLVLSAVARLIYAIDRRLQLAAWVPLIVAVVVLLFGELLRLPMWLRDVSPFQHMPLVPAVAFDWLPVAALCAVALAISGMAHWLFTRRDIY